MPSCVCGVGPSARFCSRALAVWSAVLRGVVGRLACAGGSTACPTSGHTGTSIRRILLYVDWKETIWPRLPSNSPCSQAPARLGVCGRIAKVLEGHGHSYVPTTMYGLLVSLSLLCLYSFPSSGVISVKSRSVFMRATNLCTNWTGK